MKDDKTKNPLDVECRLRFTFDGSICTMYALFCGLSVENVGTFSHGIAGQQQQQQRPHLLRAHGRQARRQWPCTGDADFEK